MEKQPSLLKYTLSVIWITGYVALIVMAGYIIFFAGASIDLFRPFRAPNLSVENARISMPQNAQVASPGEEIIPFGEKTVELSLDQFLRMAHRMSDVKVAADHVLIRYAGKLDGVTFFTIAYVKSETRHIYKEGGFTKVSKETLHPDGRLEIKREEVRMYDKVIFGALNFFLFLLFSGVVFFISSAVYVLALGTWKPFELRDNCLVFY